MFTEYAGPQPQPHLLGDRRGVENLVTVDARTDRRQSCSRLCSLQHHVIERGHGRAPLGLDHGGGVRLGDDRRAVDAVSRAEVLAPVERRVVPAPAGEHADDFRRTCLFLRRQAPFLENLPPRDRLDRHRFRNQRPAGLRKENCLR
jgi:hypothetical protein